MKKSCYRKVLGIGSLIALTAFTTVNGAVLPLELLTKLNWSASPGSSVVGYAVYYGLGVLPITTRVDAGSSLTATLPLVVGTDYSLYVVAYDADGVESLPSNIVNYTPPPLTRLKMSKQADGAIRLQFRTSALVPCRVEYASDLTSPLWQSLGSVVADLNGEVLVDDPGAGSLQARFYRAVRL